MPDKSNMEGIMKLVDKGPTFDKLDDDLADRLNSRYTVFFLVVFTIVVSTQLYVGTPITCWTPVEFTKGWIKYTNSYCWVKNTYYLPLEDEIPRVPSGERVKRELLYYQWLPFILLIQALFFYLPSVVWHGLNQKAGVDCDSILAAANKYKNTQEEAGRKKLLGLIVNQMDRFLLFGTGTDSGSEMKIRGFIKKAFCCFLGSAHGKYLIVLYLFSKLLYVGNVIAQFFILNHILKSAYSFYGYDLINNVVNDKYWVNSENFPRVTMCDFTVRKLGNLHTYTVQCVLPINMYTEKIYAFLWVWMLFVLFFSALSFVQWLLRAVFTQDKYRYLRSHLRHSNALNVAYPNDVKKAKHAVQEFADEYLKQDGIFMLWLIGHNTNNMTVTDVTKAMWENWLEKHKKNDDSNDKPLHSSADEPDGKN